MSTIISLQTKESLKPFIQFLTDHGFYEGIPLNGNTTLWSHDICDHLVAPPQPLHPKFIPPTPVGEVWAHVNRVAHLTKGEAMEEELFPHFIASLQREVKKQFKVIVPNELLPTYEWYLECYELWNGNKQNALTRGIKMSPVL